MSSRRRSADGWRNQNKSRWCPSLEPPPHVSLSTRNVFSFIQLFSEMRGRARERDRATWRERDGRLFACFIHLSSSPVCFYWTRIPASAPFTKASSPSLSLSHSLCFSANATPFPWRRAETLLVCVAGMNENIFSSFRPRTMSSREENSRQFSRRPRRSPREPTTHPPGTFLPSLSASYVLLIDDITKKAEIKRQKHFFFFRQP